MKPDKKRQSQQAFDQQAATYDTAIQGSHARTLYPYMLQEITHARGDRVLDLGCGTGALTAQVLEQDPRRQVTGLDLSEQMLAQARARLGDRVKLIQGDSECLPFPDGSFDVVYCCDSFHHYPDPAAVLALSGARPDLACLLDPVDLGNLLFLGLGASALCFVTWNFAVKELGAVKTSVYIYLVPVITVAASVAILDEPFTWMTGVGTALTLMGLFLSEGKFQRRAGADRGTGAGQMRPDD